MSKLQKFYCLSQTHYFSNRNFFAFWRFFLYDGPEDKLGDFVTPQVADTSIFTIEKRKGRMPATTRSYEIKVLSTIYKRAKEMESGYPRTVEEDLKTVSKGGISFKKKYLLSFFKVALYEELSRNSLIEVIGERKSLKVLLELLECGLWLLSMKTKEEAQAAYEKKEPIPTYDGYIRDDLLNVKWD